MIHFVVNTAHRLCDRVAVDEQKSDVSDTSIASEDFLLTQPAMPG